MSNPPGEPVHDFIILTVPPGVDPDDPVVRLKLEDEAQRNVLAQYRRLPKALVMDPIEWVITSDWRDVTQVQPGDGCATCIAGNDQAIAFLKEHPERTLALGNMKYWEIW